LETFGDTPEYQWIYESCENYGFIVRYPEDSEEITGYVSEPWHITFIGKTAALDMKSKSIKTLEEYAAKNAAILSVPVIDDRKTVVLDAGHGGVDTGSQGNGIDEKDINLSIAQILKESLEQNGLRVLMVRSDDVGVENLERTKTANQTADLFISIHQNAFEDASVHGVETWYNSLQKDSSRLAKTIHENLLEATGSADRGLYDDHGLVVLRTATVPAVLVETGYISNPSELALLTSAEYKQKIAAGICEGVLSFLEPKIMYLTFDDGPSPKNTPVILDILKARDIKATFFVIGENAEKYPELIKRIVDEGHEIGVHCYNHTYNDLYQSVESYKNDFYKARQIIADITGIEPVIYRFPGGSINSFNKNVYQDIMSEMNRLGFIYFDWNASIEDAKRGVVASDLIQSAKNNVGRQKNVILLAHDTSAVTAEALAAIIDLFPEFKNETVTKETKPIQFAIR
jgi:N-acetylmuramoyl-L-alanine amidase CwlD